MATCTDLAAAVENALGVNLQPLPDTFRGLAGGVLRPGAPAEAVYLSHGHSFRFDDDRVLFLFELAPWGVKALMRPRLRSLIAFLECAGVLEPGSLDLGFDEYDDSDGDELDSIVAGARRFLRTALRHPANNSIVVNEVLYCKDYEVEWADALPDLAEESVLDLDGLHIIDPTAATGPCDAVLGNSVTETRAVAALSASATSASVVAAPALPLPTSAVEITAATAQALLDNIDPAVGSFDELCDTELKEDAPLAAAARAGQFVRDVGMPPSLLCLLNIRPESQLFRPEDNRPGIRIAPRAPHFKRFLAVAGVLADDGDGWIPEASYSAVCAGVYAFLREQLQVPLTHVALRCDIDSKMASDPSWRQAMVTSPGVRGLTVDAAGHLAWAGLITDGLDDDEDDDASAAEARSAARL